MATQFRRYYSGNWPLRYATGTCFFASTAGTRIVNYPKQHSANRTTKHQDTNRRFKPMVRVLKNLRNCMIDNGVVEAGLARSYLLEDHSTTFRTGSSAQPTEIPSPTLSTGYSKRNAASSFARTVNTTYSAKASSWDGEGKNAAWRVGLPSKKIDRSTRRCAVAGFVTRLQVCDE
jgi:hypothetical protein